MKNKLKINFLSILITFVLIFIFNIFLNGMYLFGMPNKKDVYKITISYPKVSEEVKEIYDKEGIEYAVSLTGYLRYSVFGKVETKEESLVTVTYYSSEKPPFTVFVNNDTVILNDKAHALKKDNIFVNVIEGLFF